MSRKGQAKRSSENQLSSFKSADSIIFQKMSCINLIHTVHGVQFLLEPSKTLVHYLQSVSSSYISGAEILAVPALAQLILVCKLKWISEIFVNRGAC